MALNANQTTSLNKAARKPIKEAFAELPTYWASKCWLGRRNRYAVDTVKRFNADSPAFKKADLRRYVAASTAFHCVDGWTYLGGALQALLAGDSSVSLHLAYYAELRATMALLASEGIGVFDKKHVAVESSRKCHAVNGPGTHVFAWEALLNWASTASAKNILFKIIRASGHSLGVWLDRFSTAGGVQGLLAQSWLESWGIDLLRMADQNLSDRAARNLVSYRPNDLTLKRAVPPTEVAEYLVDLWRLLEPKSSNAFEAFDRHLIREAIRRAFTAANSGASHKVASARFRRNVESMLHLIGLSPADEEMWREFLLDKAKEAPINLLSLASRTSMPDQEGFNLQIVSRAVILLRLASGACEDLAGAVSNKDKIQLDFWRDALGEDRGLWDATTKPASATDLWADLEPALDSVTAWLASLPRAQLTYASLWRDNAAAAAALSSSELMVLWGLGL